MTYEHYIKNIYKEVPQLKDRKLTDEQIELILEPIELQERFYQDGELNESKARDDWFNRLDKNGLLISDLIRYILDDENVDVYVY